MTLPVSSYEALLVQVRELTHETILLQRQLSSELYQNVDTTDVNHNLTHYQKNYEQGKLVVDNVIRRYDKNIEIGQRTRIDRNEFAFHPRLIPSLDCPRENFNSGELTARLIAWRDQNFQRRPSYGEETSYRRQKGAHRPDLTTTGIPSVCRVGVDGSGSSSFLSWESSSGAPTLGRSYYDVGAPGDSALSNREHRTIAEQLQQSAIKLSLPQATTSTTTTTTTTTSTATATATLVPRSSESRERCVPTRTSYRAAAVGTCTVHEPQSKGHDMEGKDDETNSPSPSPELYTRTGKCYDEDGSSEEESKQEDGSQAHRLSSLYHGTWPVKRDLWTNQQMNFTGPQTGSSATQHNDMASVMSFSSSTCMSSCSAVGMQGHRRLGAKVDVVYSLLGMLGSTEGREDMSSTLLAMSNSLDSCLVMRQSGCLPLLVQLIHAPGQDSDTRDRASRALHNVIHARSDEKIGRREARVLRLLEQVRDFCQALRASLETERPPDDLERHPGPTIAALMKLSFDEAHRHAMCQLGGLHAVAELIEMDHAAHGSESDDQSCITLRRYAGMALTNLTFGDGNNKALLCSFRAFMRALVSQLQSMSDDLRQVTASVLRNLSWRADSSSKQTLREVGAVIGLMKAAMEGRKESTLKSILSALWNLSAHCSTNKVDICAVEGALAFLVDMLSYKAPSKTLSIVENAGGILRNVSSHIAVREDYRSIVRDRDCLPVLLRQLRSPSLTVVSNACGALWNLSARCSHDQRLLWDLGAVPMLRSLVHSKHKMISMGSSAALKNLLSARPAGNNLVHLDSTARGLGLSTLPTLVARRQRALEQEIDQNLAETCDNIEPSTSPINKDDKFSFKIDDNYVDVNGRNRNYHNNSVTTNTKYNTTVTRSDSRESMRSVTSTHSDTIFERVNRHVNNTLTNAEMQIKQQSSSLHSAVGFNNQQYNDTHNKSNNKIEKKYALKYKNSIPERLRPTDLSINEIGDLRCTTSTMSWATAPDQEATCSQIVMNSSVEDCLSSMSNSKLSVRSNDFIKRNDNSQINYKSTIIGNFEDINSPTLSHNSENGDPFEVYAETDIDQPTNYSLRYAERNSDEEDKQSSGYFAGSEQDTEDTVKNYYTDGTPYENPLNSSGAASDNDITDACKIRVAQKIHLGRINDIRRENMIDAVRTDVGHEHHLQNGAKILDPELSILPNSLEIDSDVTKSSESLADSGLAVAERSQTSGCESETLKLSLDVDSSMDVTLTRLNSLVLDDEPKIINESRHSNHELRSNIDQNICLDVESFPETMISDDDDEDLLAACIHIGMQNNRHRQSFRRNSLEKTPPEESNLARYQTSTSLDQVEDSKFTEQTDRHSETHRFNIKMTPETSNNYRDPESLENDYQSFEDNFNIVQDDDKITVEYQKFQNYSEDSKTSSIDKIDGIVSSNLQSMTKIRENRSNSIEDNLANDDCLQMENPKNHQETNNSVDLETFDTIESSEHALLQLCIKNDDKNSESAVILSEKSVISIDDNLSVISRDCDEINENPTISRIKETQARHVEDEYRRQRDPDAMIASLDRLTATLVQQTEAMRERDTSLSMKQSILSDTWNEDSPNDVSYPSISVSAPLIASFKSDDENTGMAPMPTLREAENCIESTIMTNSRIIEIEAIRLAEAVQAEGQQQQSINHDYGTNSLTSIDLEAIKPPSTINSLISLTHSYAGINDNNDITIDNTTSLEPIILKNNIYDCRYNRKKSLPIGVMAKRAISQGINNAGSLESLLNDCSINTISQLENVKPPSMMDEIFDNGDMENSMISVSSITSEIADKDQYTNINDHIYDNIKTIDNDLTLNCMIYEETMDNSANNSISEYLENINPPSLFNEINDIDDTNVEHNTDTICSDTLCIDNELRTEEAPHSIIVDKIEENDYYDDNNDTDDAATPIHTESCFGSSAESTPKKRQNKNSLTPKQKRQLAKERYKTYTIAAELVKKEEEERKKNEQDMNKILRGKLSPFTKLTPKQRRQEDRARFQTQVLDNPLPDFSQRLNNAVSQISTINIDNTEENYSVKSGIPTFSGSRTFRKKRLDSEDINDRYRTRTLNDIEGIISDNLTTNQESHDVRTESMQTMLEKNANIVLHTLNETNKGDSIVEDVMLDCETLSLVSNDSECEQNARIRVPSEGLGKKLMTSYVQKAFYLRQEEEEEKEEEEQAIAINREDIVETPEISDDESIEDSPQPELLPQDIKRPKITKPGVFNRDKSVDSNVADKSEPCSPKAIRGRRKALYSTPNTRKSTPQSSPIKQINSGIPRSNTSPVVRATRATTLRQNTNTNVTKETRGSSVVVQKTSQIINSDKRAKSASTLAKRSSIPQRGTTIPIVNKTFKRHSTPPVCTTSNKEPRIDIQTPKPLERQGTFTKDEPEVVNLSTVVSSSPLKSKIAKPTKNSPIRVNNVVKSKISVRTYQNSQQSKQLIKCTSVEKIQSSRISTTNGGKRTIEPSIYSRADQSASTQPEITRIPRIPVSLGQRSNSNSSIVSTSGTTTRKLPKEATSKIASLWKKVEDSKNKQKYDKPDTRQWITAANDTVDSTEIVANKPPTPFRLFRSSTFEGIPQEDEEPNKKDVKTTDCYDKYRNSCDLTGISSAEGSCKIPVKYTNVKNNCRDTPIGYSTIVLRKHRSVDSTSSTETDNTKRISRLGSFFRVDGNDTEIRDSDNTPRTSNNVNSFHYNSRQETPSSTITRLDDDCQTDIVTGSARVTTV